MKFLFTLKSKMIIGFFAILLIMFAVLAYLCYEVLGPQLIQAQLDTQTRLAQVLCTNILSWKNDCEKVSAQIDVDESVQAYFRASAGVKANMQAQVCAVLQNYKNNNDFIKAIYLVDKSYNIIGVGDTGNFRSYAIDRISSAERAAGGAAWDSGYDTDCMILFRTVNNVKYNPSTSIGYLFISIDNTEIVDLFDHYRLYDGQRFSLKGHFDGFEVTEQGFFYHYYDRFSELLHVEVTLGPWFLRTWSSKSVALRTSNTMLQRIEMTILLSCAAAFVFCVLVAQQVAKPVTQMKEALKYYGAGDFSAKVDIAGHDEMAELGHIMNDMSEQISDLFDMVKQEATERKKLELQTLVYQINPHFLYNTLDSVSVIARQHGDMQAAELATALARLFRLGLHHGEEFVNVRDELAHVTYYLQIQHIRFAQQLRWKIDVDESLYEIKICKFILQPVVENALYYGVKSRENGGTIQIKGELNGNELCFSVVDDGEGISDEDLERVRIKINAQTIPEGQSSGFGLWNVNQRLKIYYGASCGVQIFSTYGQGTTVKLRLKIGQTNRM